MSDLTATNCGSCSTNFGGGCGCGNNSIVWILLLLFFCGGNNGGGCGMNSIFGSNNGGCGCDNDCGCGCGASNSNNGCNWIIWIILLSCICGGNNGCC